MRIKDIQSGIESCVGNVCERQCSFWGGQWNTRLYLAGQHNAFTILQCTLLEPLRVPYVSDMYLLKETFTAGLPTSMWYSIWAFWSSHNDAPLQKLGYEATSLWTLPAAGPELDQAALRALSKKLENRQPTQRGRSVDHIYSSSNRHLTQGHR